MIIGSLLPRFQEEFARLAGSSVLEIGSGRYLHDSPGNHRHWVPDAREYVGLDLTAGPEVDVVGDAHYLNGIFPPARFDAVISAYTLEHIARPWIVAQQIAHVLRPGGILFLATNHTFPLHSAPSDYYRFSANGLEVLFGPPDFEVIESAHEQRCNVTSEFNEGVNGAEAYLLAHVLARRSAASLSVVITCKGFLPVLKQSLPLWLIQQTPAEILVVDYGCPDGTADWIATNYPAVRCVRVTRDSEWFNMSRARNIGGCAASGKAILFADADFLPGPDYTAQVLDRIRGGAEVVPSGYYGWGDHPTEPQTGGQCAMTASLFHRLRGFDESFEGYGWEDVDILNRAKAAGAAFRYVYHPGHIPHSLPHTKFFAEKDASRSAEQNFQRCLDHYRCVNPRGYGQL